MARTNKLKDAVTLTDTQTLSNKTINWNSNTIINVNGTVTNIWDRSLVWSLSILGLGIRTVTIWWVNYEIVTRN